MNRDPLILRLAWTGALAVLALLAWAGALAGVGADLRPYAGALQPPADLPALPDQADTAAAREGARLAASERPAFTPDRQPRPFLMALSGAPGGAPSGLRLTGTVITPVLKMATLSTGQGPSLRLRLGGGAVEGWTLLDLTATTATVQGPAGTLVLDLELAPAGDGAAAPGSVAAGGGEAAARSGPAGAMAGPAAGAAAVGTVPGAATVFPAGGVAGRGLPVSSTAPALAEQALATRQRIESERRQLRQQRPAGNDGKDP